MAIHLSNSRCARGEGELRVEMVAGQSAIVGARCSNPLKILVPRPRGHSVLACLSNYGGGLVAGDEINLTINLGAGTRCFLSTQASTKVYRNPRLLPCGQNLTANLGEESVLVLAPDPIQAFGGSIYKQHQEFHITEGAGLALVDWLSSGRSERGERWVFSRYESRNEIFVGGKKLMVDSLLLDPADGAIGGRYRMGRFNCLALMALVGGALQKPAERLLELFASRPIASGAALVCSASPLSEGILVRIAGEQVEAVRREINQLLDFLPEVLDDDPRARKW